MKLFNRLFCICFLLSLFFPFCARMSAQTYYRNPVIAGDYPDPTVIRVGDTYYSAATTSEWGAPFRFYESKDLINWDYVGSLMKELPDWTMGSYWAPELAYFNGTYYAYYTARRKSDQKSFIGVATTKDISKGFTDHGLIIEWTNEAIDPYVIELDGKRYITWKAYGLDQDQTIQILGSELSEDGLKLIGEPFHLLTADLDNWEAGGIEGQCLVKKGDYIYLFYAGNNCCGRDCNYQTGVARSKSIRGPWMKYEGNPILFGDEHFRCSGHGTLVETPEHRYFYLYHAYDATSSVYLGRQGMLDEVIWDQKTAWPYFRYGKTPSLQAETPLKNTIQKPLLGFIDHFDQASLNTRWRWDVSLLQPKSSILNGQLRLEAQNSGVGSFLALKAEKGNYQLSAELNNSKGVSVGICIYSTADQAMGLSVIDGRAELWKLEKGTRIVLASQGISSFPVSLTLKTEFGQFCQFGMISDRKAQSIGELVHISDFTNWDRPPMIGVQASGKGTGLFDSVHLMY